MSGQCINAMQGARNQPRRTTTSKLKMPLVMKLSLCLSSILYYSPHCTF